MIYDAKNPYEADKARAQLEKLVAAGKTFEIKEKHAPRTNQQNRYLHLIISWFALEYGITAEEAKIDFFKRTCNRELFEEFVPNKRGQMMRRLRSTASLDTAQLSTAIDRFRNWSSAVAGIYLPAAGEESFLLHVQKEIERNKELV